MRFKTTLRAGLSFVLLSGMLPVVAGNVPQYSFSRMNKAFEPLTDAIQVPATYSTGAYLYAPGGVKTNLKYSGDGFDIGFDFKFAGQVMNKFAIFDNGALVFGKDKIESRGYLGNLFGNAGIYGADNSFYAGMIPIAYGIKSGDSTKISYKVSGSEGNRVLTVEFNNMILDENSSVNNCGRYSLQIKCYEADGKIEYHFAELDTVRTGNFGFATGLNGWERTDRLILTSKGIASDDLAEVDPAIGDASIGSGSQSFVNWDCNDIYWSDLADDELEEGERNKPYEVVISLTPEANPNAPVSAPGKLMFSQDKNSVTVSCKRGEDAKATMMLYSYEPMTDAELPVDGVTYRAYDDIGPDERIYPTTIGKATLMYYDRGETPSFTINDVPEGKTIYVRALSVNGTPVYNRENMTEDVFETSHAAPRNFYSRESTDGSTISMEWQSQFPDVIIAVTNERVAKLNDGNGGVFGRPEATAAVGDELEGGGKVIYVGNGTSFDYTEALSNRLHFLRIWSVKDGKVSSTFADLKAVPAASLPFEPKVEDWTLNERPLTWTSMNEEESQNTVTYFCPRVRDYAGDNALTGISVNGSKVTLITPKLNMTGPCKLTFEWAMETVLPAAAVEDPSEPTEPGSGPVVELPQGNKPGEFGEGHSLKIYSGRSLVADINSYNGTMTATNQGGYYDGSATWIPVEYEIPNTGNNPIRFEFTTAETSHLSLRNIKVSSASGVQNVGAASENGDVEAFGGDGHIVLKASTDASVSIFSVDGRIIDSVDMSAGETMMLSLDKGVYIVSGKKVLVK